jgi:predicted PurR-regulated permease PerM
LQVPTVKQLTDVQIPTTNTEPREVPHSTRDDVLPPSDPKTALLTGIFLLAALATAYWAAEIILPLVLAVLLKLLFQPGMRVLERARVPRTLAALLLIFAVFGTIIGIGAAVSGPATNWAGKLPEGLSRLQERLQFLGQPIQSLQIFLGNFSGNEKLESGAPSLFGMLAALFTGTRHFATGFFETVLILFFLLVSGDTFLRKLVEFLPAYKDKRQAVELSQQIEENVSVYLVTITIMNAAVGIATGFAMWACGLGDPVLWGVLAFLLNYVPIIGPFAGVIVFVLAGLLTIDVFWQALLPAGLYLMIHIIEGQIVTPMLLARRFTLNPVLVVITLIFWFWMWGVPGAVLAVPMLAIAKIIFDGIKSLKALGHFLEG